MVSPVFSTNRRFEPRVSCKCRTSPLWRRRSHCRDTGSDSMPVSGGSVESSAAVSQACAGAITFPSLFLCGRSFTLRGPGSSGPVRSFGPARSITIKQSWPVASAACRTWPAMERHASASSCAQLMRAMFIPRSTNSRTNAGLVAAEEGNVTMMRVTRSAGSGPSRSCRPGRGVYADDS